MSDVLSAEDFLALFEVRPDSVVLRMPERPPRSASSVESMAYAVVATLFARVVAAERERDAAERFGYTLSSGRLFCDFSEFQARCEKIVGQPLYTHEFTDEDKWDHVRLEFENDATAALQAGVSHS